MKPVDGLSGTDALSPPGTRAARVTHWQGARCELRADLLAEEVAVALVINGISHAVMLASPTDLEDFALGFALTEGLIERPDDLFGVEVQPVDAGIELQLTVSAGAEWGLRQRRRSLAGRTGCGLCGTDSLAQVERALAPAPTVCVPARALGRAQRELWQHQQLQQLTGATHAAAWCGLDGRVELLREDVGRHNALDKLIGALVKAGTDGSGGFAAITSRASFEMVQKSVAAGIGAMAAVSAPTTRAVRSAESLNLALAGFVRGQAGVAYTFAERFGLTPQT
ncbi:MAG TPA: formate dehydrogenase accessory sulfurtransferase FdhD [Hydrogenophaga sp.]|uniref:formate dehydrogenase accessory sulfurtransferase FdhD n=1 Tax=Hydrogenophaga sp. TaxID=1904254 RepID=UPI002BA7138D|nr:formate dehydrogenase accessory sulfurtransferase FdhD [Hydrogenophaga sp.]HMN92770.1 formate dehydrogenase accessory sulfurtransferase FdhD [Hydrogenophaga sp.]HMP11341.1 formate dehydrogenase accessory sulfurtransferase FdhD [Hydrogenophaga sp.]